MANPRPIMANVFGYTKYINADADCIDDDFDDEVPLYLLMPRVPQDETQHLS